MERKTALPARSAIARMATVQKQLFLMPQQGVT